MLSDRAMWAAVLLVDHLRNGEQFEDARQMHAGRALAALLNAYGRRLDEYWERKIERLDGANYPYVLACAGYTSFELEPLFHKYYDVMSDVLASRSWEAFMSLPTPVWKLLARVTGMKREEWDSLPFFSREYLSENIVCPECGYSKELEHFGEPDPIDDPTYFYAQRMSLVFHCPECGTEVMYDVKARESKEYTTAIFGRNKFYRLGILSIFIGLIVATLLFLLFRNPPY